MRGTILDADVLYYFDAFCHPMLEKAAQR